MEPKMWSPFEERGKEFWRIALLVPLFAIGMVTNAAANSNSYNFSASFGSQQILGTLTWNTTTNSVIAYFYSLSSANGLATYSSLLSCGLLNGKFGNQVVGMLTPYVMGGTNYIYLTTSSGT
jgi:hypothetical protein